MKEALEVSWFSRKGNWSRTLFAVLYFSQLGGSIVFLRWLFTDAWNQKYFLTSFLFGCAEIIAFISTALWLFSGLFGLVHAKSTELIFSDLTQSDLDPTKHDRSFSGGADNGSSSAGQGSPPGKVFEEVRLVVGDELGMPSQPKVKTVAVCVCRYKESLDDLLQTIECMNNIKSSHNVQLYILDDGWHTMSDENKLTQLEALQGVLGTTTTIEEEDKLPAFETTALYRPDCASECTFLTLHDGFDGHKSCTLIARKKPTQNCHFKAGNVNNFLYNFLGHLAETNQDVPTYMLMLDHDMLPHDDIVEDALFFLQHDTTLAFVQYPQRFYDLRGSDLFHAGNEVFFDGVQVNRGHIGLAAFAGTNAVWAVKALLHVGGLQYNTLTEDNSTGYAVHRLGYTSLYNQRELAVGQSPQTVKDAMRQRMRWSQGAVEILVNTLLSSVMTSQQSTSSAWMSPALSQKFEHESAAPNRPSVIRRLVVFLVYLDSMIYPFYSLGFVLHVAVCILYLATTEAPISAEDPRAILIYWLPLYGVKYSCQLLAFSSVSLAAHWTSQMAWAGYSLSTLASIFQGFWNRLFKLRGVWFNTGARAHDVFYLQYGNTMIAMLIYFMIVYRGFAFIFIDKTCDPWVSIGSILYGFVLLFHVQGWAAEPIKALFRTRQARRLQQRSWLRARDADVTPEGSISSTRNASELAEAFGKARRHREQHRGLDLSILFVVTSVALFTFILFFWAENSCIPAALQQDTNIVDIPQPKMFTSPLPNSTDYDIEFSAEGGKILLNGKNFKIKGANWFGFETELNAPFGLYKVTQDSVLHLLVQHGFNALRLPLAAGSVLDPLDHLVPNEGTVGGGSNPHLNISSYLDLVETFVNKTASWGVFTLLDIHRLRSNKDNTPYPFDDITTFDDLKAAWSILAERFCSSWSIMGADLLNEPWGVTWGDDSATDWRILSQDLAETVLSICPKWLIFVEGQWILDRAISPVNLTDFAPWGGSLTAAKEYPVEISNPKKLVYSPHVYGPGSIGISVVWSPVRDEALLLCQCGIRSQVIEDLCQQFGVTGRSYEAGLNVSILRENADSYCTNMLPLPEHPFPENMAYVWDFLFGYLSELNHTVVVGEWGGKRCENTSQ